MVQLGQRTWTHSDKEVFLWYVIFVLFWFRKYLLQRNYFNEHEMPYITFNCSTWKVFFPLIFSTFFNPTYREVTRSSDFSFSCLPGMKYSFFFEVLELASEVRSDSGFPYCPQQTFHFWKIKRVPPIDKRHKKIAHVERKSFLVWLSILNLDKEDGFFHTQTTKKLLLEKQEKVSSRYLRTRQSLSLFSSTQMIKLILFRDVKLHFKLGRPKMCLNFKRRDCSIDKDNFSNLMFNEWISVERESLNKNWTYVIDWIDNLSKKNLAWSIGNG